ncbi:MAG: potassium transporter TrkG [Eubacteriales bacterium]|nr:potassium transporter TrkG [Eubacteriales bacterium]
MNPFRLIRHQTPGRIIALGFLLVIFIGSGLLMLPCCVKSGVTLRYIDALYTSASAVCVTGLISVDAGDTFTPLGQFVLAALIQTGGLGVTSMGAGIMIAMGQKVNLKGRTLIREALNVSSPKGMVRLVKSIFLLTVTFELLGAIASYPSFVRDFPPKRALGISLFHSVAAFNNSGFDILGGGRSLTPYQDDVMLNLVTCVLIFFGGIGFLAIREMIDTRLRWRKFSMHTKVVLSVSGALLVIGTLLLKMTEDISWLGAFFNSVSARTAGFATYPLQRFSEAGLLVIILLMFIGASSGSTGGGIKTGTLFVLLSGIYSAATNHTEKAFHCSVPPQAFKKAAVITLLAMALVVSGTYLFLVFEPELSLLDALFEATSAFGTVGLSTGVTSTLGVPAKLLTIFIMYVGRLGPLTIASLWHFTHGERIRYPEGNIAIG